MANAVFLLAVGLFGGAAAPKEPPKPEYPSKEDEVPFTSLPVELTPKRMMKLDEFYAPGSDKPVWSRLRKARRKEEEDEYPPTLIGLPLVYPPPERTSSQWKAVKDAIQVALTTNRAGKKYIQVERKGYDRRDRRCKMPPRGVQFAMYDKFVRPDTISQNNNGTFGPLWIPVRYPSAPRVISPYWLVLRDNKEDSSYYEFRRAAYWEGKLPDRKGERVKVVDENSNGWFNDYGHDIIVVGSKGPTFLSKMVILGGKLYHMKVAPSGAKVWLKPYAGDTGGIDVLSKFKAPTGCKLASVIIQAEGGGPSFDVVPSARRTGASKKAAMHVPVGKYVVIDGSLVKSGANYRILQGFMEPFEVKKGEMLVLEWGKPMSLEFKAEGLKFGISIRDCGIYGSAGEIYITTGEEEPRVMVRFRKETGPRMRDVPLMEYGPDGKLKPYTYDPGRKGYYWITLMQKLRLLGSKKLQKTTRIAHNPSG